MKYKDVNWTHVKIKKFFKEILFWDIFRAIKDLIKGKPEQSKCEGCTNYYSIFYKIKWGICWREGKLVGFKQYPKMSLGEAFARLERKRLYREQINQ